MTKPRDAVSFQLEHVLEPFSLCLFSLNQVEDSEDTGMGSITPNSSGFSAESSSNEAAYSNHYNSNHQTITTN